MRLLATASKLPDVCLMTSLQLPDDCQTTAHLLFDKKGLKRLISDHSGQWGFLAKASKRGFETFHMFLKVKWRLHCTQPCTMWLRCDVSPHSEYYICNMTQEKNYSCVFLHFSYLILVHGTYSQCLLLYLVLTELLLLCILCLNAMIKMQCR